MFKAVHGVSTVEFLTQGIGMSQEAFGQTAQTSALPEPSPRRKRPHGDSEF